MERIEEILPRVAEDIETRFKRRCYPEEIEEIKRLEEKDQILHWINNIYPLWAKDLGRVCVHMGGGYEGIICPFISAFRGPYR